MLNQQRVGQQKHWVARAHLCRMLQARRRCRWRRAPGCCAPSGCCWTPARTLGRAAQAPPHRCIEQRLPVRPGCDVWLAIQSSTAGRVLPRRPCCHPEQSGQGLRAGSDATILSLVTPSFARYGIVLTLLQLATLAVMGAVRMVPICRGQAAATEPCPSIRRKRRGRRGPGRGGRGPGGSQRRWHAAAVGGWLRHGGRRRGPAGGGRGTQCIGGGPRLRRVHGHRLR